MRKGFFVLVSIVTMLAAASPKLRIGYYNHSMFEIVLPSGVRIITDPFDMFTGPDFPEDVEADIVVMSHSHTDHSYSAGVSGSPDLISWANGSSHGIDFTATATKHFPAGAEGENHIMSWETERFKFVHMGDYGDELSSEDSAALANTTFLFIPVGGDLTIDAAEANDLINNTGPVVAFPMHYKTPDHSAGFASLLTLDEANSSFTFDIVEHDPWIAIDPDVLPQGPVIWEPRCSSDLPADLMLGVLNANFAIIINNSSYDAGESDVIRLVFDGEEVVHADTGSVSGLTASEMTIYEFEPWNPPVPKEYKIFVEVVCPADENPSNDTLSNDFPLEGIRETDLTETEGFAVRWINNDLLCVHCAFTGDYALLLIYDVTGQEVARKYLDEDNQGTFYYRTQVHLSQGVYFARLVTSQGAMTDKFVRLR